MLILLRCIIHLGCFSPMLWLIYAVNGENESLLGSDPVKEIEHFLGYTALIIFCVMFLIGILFQWLKTPHFQILRRPLGLWAFVWAVLHITSYFSLELGLDSQLFLTELATRPYLIIGFIAFLILSIMALTSLPMLKQKLGKKWFAIHQWGYFSISLATIHYYWSLKSITFDVVMITCCVLFILFWKYALPYCDRIKRPFK